MSKFVPNSFQVPNAFVDEVLNKISDAAVKIYLLTARKTRGWQKEMDAISTSQFEEFTGKSRPTVIRCIKELITVGLLVECTETRHGKVYKLGEETNIGIHLKVTSKKSLLVKNFNYPSKKILLLLVKNFYPQKQLSKTTNQKKEKKGWLDFEVLKKHLSQKNEGVNFEQITTACDLKYQIELFEDYNADNQLSANLKHAYFATWLINAYNETKQAKTTSGHNKKSSSEKPKQARTADQDQQAPVEKPKTNGKPPLLSYKQVGLFAKLLAEYDPFASQHAEPGELTEDLEKRLRMKLGSPDYAQSVMKDLEAVGYKQNGVGA